MTYQGEEAIFQISFEVVG